MTLQNNKKRKGFTIIELIVVISIIGILASLGISSYSNVQKNARNSKRKGDLKQLSLALADYYSQNGRYPSTCPGGALTCAYSASSWYSDTGCYWNPRANWIPGLAPTYIDSLPEDPRQLQTNTSSVNNTCKTTANRNCYIYKSNGTDYKLLSICTPEGTLTNDDPFYDQARGTYSWQVHSSATSISW